MNNFAVGNLEQMEKALYGYKAGMNLNYPSYVNGYMGTNSFMNYYNPMFRAYNNYNNKDIFTQYNDATTVNNPYQSAQTGYQGNTQVDWANPKVQPQFQGVTQEDMDNLADYYAKNNALEEGFMGAAAGGLSWMAFEHAQSIFHPLNAWKGIKYTKEMFKGLPKEFVAKNAALLQEAQIAVQQVVRDTGSKGWWSKWIRKPLYIEDPKKIANMSAEEVLRNTSNKEAITRELKNMENALREAARTGNVEKVAEITERLQATRGMDGKIARIFSKGRTVEERLAEKASKIKTGKDNALFVMNDSVINNKFGQLLKSSFKKDFLGFMLFETVFNIGQIMTAFKKDTKTGVEQTFQSVGKTGLGTAGWCVGRAAGTLLAAKAGATLGMAGGPLGAGIGALIGFTVGSIGMWAGHKLGNLIFGKDVADKVEANNLAKTPEGQAQLLQFAMEKAQEGKTDPKTNQIVYKALSAYA